ncbi:hypothetical protein vBEfaHEF1TV_176 [Enterococcus phage vB_EfaH_EF1TV]|nr:hypothetical protein vBEfaHEF1TV_176 [Enterococcus phage vB_EfaH_EF1TV]
MNKKETLLNTTVTFLGRTSRSSRPKGKQLLCEMQNSDGSVEFIFDGTVFYVHSMAVVYMENKKHSMQATVSAVDGNYKYAGITFKLEVDYKENTLLLEEI